MASKQAFRRLSLSSPSVPWQWGQRWSSKLRWTHRSTTSRGC